MISLESAKLLFKMLDALLRYLGKTNGSHFNLMVKALLLTPEFFVLAYMHQLHRHFTSKKRLALLVLVIIPLRGHEKLET